MPVIFSNDLYSVHHDEAILVASQYIQVKSMPYKQVSTRTLFHSSDAYNIVVEYGTKILKQI